MMQIVDKPALDTLVYSIIEWAAERGLLDSDDPTPQLLKTVEELGELAGALAKGNREATIDGYGDTIVTLIIGMARAGLSMEECLSHAYAEIANRKGKLVNGIFVKEGD